MSVPPAEKVVRQSKVFGGAEEGWLVQQAQYDLAHVRRDRIEVKRLEVACENACEVTGVHRRNPFSSRLK